MSFEGVLIGFIDGPLEHEDFFLGVGDFPGEPRLEHPLGAVQKVLLPGDRNHLDPPAELSELVPKVVVHPSPGLQFAGGSHAGVDAGENGPVLLDGPPHLDVEIADAAIGPPGLDSFRKQLGVDPELLEAGDFLLRRLQRSNCNPLPIIDLLRLSQLQTPY